VEVVLLRLYTEGQVCGDDRSFVEQQECGLKSLYEPGGWKGFGEEYKNYRLCIFMLTPLLRFDSLKAQ
jgi:hypothetical protein